MKGHTAPKHRETGGVNEAKADLDMRPERRDNATKIENAAEERKHGGRTRRRHGGEVHHSRCKCEKCMGGEASKERKEGGKVEGETAPARADRAPRKSGGSATASPFSSARHGTPPQGHKMDMDED